MPPPPFCRPAPALLRSPRHPYRRVGIVDFGADGVVLHGEAGGWGFCGFLLDEFIHLIVVDAESEGDDFGVVFPCAGAMNRVP